MSAQLAYAESQPMTPEEFLKWERAAETKHEYANGKIYSMAGTSRQHVRICVNLTRHLANATAGKSCETFNNDLRVWIPRRLAYNYPDVVVVCGEAEFLDNEFDTLLNPKLVIEVLSPSTARRDLHTKFRDYRSLDSFAEYVVIAQDDRVIEHFVKREDGIWAIQEVGDELRLVTVPCVLTLDEIYDRVEFPEKPINPPVNPLDALAKSE
jgi:Uma2 family endonuclease